MTTDPRSLNLENIGPIERIEATLPECGIAVLRGCNGCGKTTVLETVRTGLGALGRLSLRDGAKRGRAEVLGLEVRVGKTTRVPDRNELEVLAIDGRGDIGIVVNPGLQDPMAADARRIKELAALMDLAPDPTIFHRVLGGQEAFDAVVADPKIGQSADIVQMAGRIKRAIEAVAKLEENQQETLRQKACSLQKAIEGIDLDLSHDATALQTALEETVGQKARLAEETRGLLQRDVERQEAERMLEEAGSRYTGPTVTQAEAHLNEAAVRKEAKGDELTGLQRQIDELSRRRAEVDTEYRETYRQETAAERALVAAREHADAVAGWQATITAMVCDPDQLCQRQATEETAQQEVNAARQAIEQGALVRRAITQQHDARVATQAAARHGSEAQRLRNAAAEVMEILGELLDCEGLTYRAGRIYVQHPIRGETLYAELSDGERWALAGPWVVKMLSPAGVGTICQEAWQGLDPVNRRNLATVAAKARVLLITAEATDGSLRLEPFSPDPSQESKGPADA